MSVYMGFIFGEKSDLPGVFYLLHCDCAENGIFIN